MHLKTEAADDLVGYNSHAKDSAGRVRPVAGSLLAGNERAFQQLGAIFPKSDFFQIIASFQEPAREVLPRAWEIIEPILQFYLPPNLGHQFAKVIYFHEKSKGCDMHIGVCKRDLRTGLKVDLLNAKAGDTEGAKILQQVLNARFGFSEPCAADRVRLEDPPSRHQLHRREHEQIDRLSCELFRNGTVSSRDELIEQLSKSGYPIGKKTRRQLYVAVPSQSEIRWVRMRGKKYTAGFLFFAAEHVGSTTRVDQCVTLLPEFEKTRHKRIHTTLQDFGPCAEPPLRFERAKHRASLSPVLTPTPRGALDEKLEEFRRKQLNPKSNAWSNSDDATTTDPTRNREDTQRVERKAAGNEPAIQPDEALSDGIPELGRAGETAFECSRRLSPITAKLRMAKLEGCGPALPAAFGRDQLRLENAGAQFRARTQQRDALTAAVEKLSRIVDQIGRATRERPEVAGDSPCTQTVTPLAIDSIEGESLQFP